MLQLAHMLQLTNQLAKQLVLSRHPVGIGTMSGFKNKWGDLCKIGCHGRVLQAFSTVLWELPLSQYSIVFLPVGLGCCADAAGLSQLVG